MEEKEWGERMDGGARLGREDGWRSTGVALIVWAALMRQSGLSLICTDSRRRCKRGESVADLHGLAASIRATLCTVWRRQP